MRAVSPVDGLINEASRHFAAGRYAEAEKLYRFIVKSAPSLPKPMHNLGALLKATGRPNEAATLLAAALSLSPREPIIRHALGGTLLSLGRYEEGWTHYEARHEAPGLKNPKPNLPYPEWRGEDLQGRRLLIWPEQGLGDKIQFSRFFPMLQERGADLTVLCEPSLTRLFAENFGVNVIAASGNVEFPEPDYWVMICTLAGRLGITLENLPSAPYLRAHQTWPELSKDPKVGLVTRGSPGHPNDANRSLTPAQAAQLGNLPANVIDLDPASSGAKDLADTAAIIDQLDLVISVDTSVAHLAGAMGKPCWVLIPALNTDWRWMYGRSDSPWYPSMRLYRQPAAGGWAPVIDKVKQDASAFLPSALQL